MIVAHCGPPAAGKSTVAAAAGERLEERDHGFRTIHSDEFSRRTYEQLYERVTESDAAPDGWLLDSGATTIRSRASRAERGGRQNTPRKRWQRSERICNRLG